MKKALVVGIAWYPNPNELANPVHDAVDVRDELVKHWSFPSSQARLLCDSRASKAAIMDGLRWLISASRPKDELVFYFSGHGSQVVDLDGDEYRDHQDEILCPHDFMMQWGAPLSDDVLARAFKPLAKGAHLTVILDCCHSGTATREITPRSSLTPKTRHIRPPLDIAIRSEGQVVNRFGLKQERGYIAVDKTMRHLLLAGCGSDQTASDGAGSHGAFTEELLAFLRSGGHTWVDGITQINKRLAEIGYQQTAQIEGPADRINGYPFGGGA
jgi:uncharacterized caspase-like protein